MTEVTGSSRPVEEKGEEEGGAYPRPTWTNRKQFLFAMVGQMMTFRTFCTLPFIIYTCGGCAFILPYGLALFFLTFPLLVLETALGQYTGRAGAAAWKMICPMFHGVGFASQVMLAYINIYYVVLPAWALYYLSSSFYSPLPWSRCDGWFNSDFCHTAKVAPVPDYNPEDTSVINATVNLDLENNAEEEFFLLNVLRQVADVSWTQINASMVPCLLLAWIICYFCVWKGARYLGKVFYVTVPISYLLLLVLLVRGLTVDGAAQGLWFLLTPDLRSVLRLHTWMAAVDQAMFSFSASLGVLPSLASYNTYKHDFYKDCLLLMGAHVASCVLTCVIAASFMGFLASSLDLPMEEVMYSGHTLVFMKFPKALSLMPASSAWAVLFFLTMLLLSTNVQLVQADNLATSIADLFPKKLRGPHRRELLLLAIALLCFLLGLPFLTKRGLNLFMIVDGYAVHVVMLLFVALFEIVSVAWLYGADRFYRNMEDMLGYRVFPVLKYCWLFITPAICVVFIQMISSVTLGFHITGYNPVITGTLGFVLMTVSLMCIPVGILVTLCKNRDAMTQPSGSLRQSGPHLPLLTLCRRVVLRAPAQPGGPKGGQEGESLTLEATA